MEKTDEKVPRDHRRVRGGKATLAAVFLFRNGNIIVAAKETRKLYRYRRLIKIDRF